MRSGNEEKSKIALALARGCTTAGYEILLCKLELGHESPPKCDDNMTACPCAVSGRYFSAVEARATPGTPYR